ncbi:hypothetical protein [Polyangium sp. 6x1]|uniref:hypothetical protein n=1 Tax=Polyangium sp. 6x1 TaxID=3042689 RepID=UPI002483139A|nr:hypothetical protein [Polyangium sp. 6x1]MDI1447054.1 hypothetical protein [Polyangium sp. 6x1]
MVLERLRYARAMTNFRHAAKRSIGMWLAWLRCEMRSFPMKSRISKKCFGVSVAILICLCAAPAAAQDSMGEDAAKAGDVPPSDLQLGGYAGLFAPDKEGTVLGLHARYRLGWFEFGGFGELGSEFISKYAGLGATAGLAWRTPFGLRLAASGAFGLHAYRKVGAGLLTSDPGADGTTPFAGARVSAGYIFGRGRNHFELGMTGLYDGDLTRPTVTTHYMDENWFNGNTYEATSTHTIGTDRFGALVTVGWTRDSL